MLAPDRLAVTSPVIFGRIYIHRILVISFRIKKLFPCYQTFRVEFELTSDTHRDITPVAIPILQSFDSPNTPPFLDYHTAIPNVNPGRWKILSSQIAVTTT